MLVLPHASSLKPRLLGEGDAPALQALCETCRDYHVLVYGEPAGPGEGLKLVSELPGGKSLQDKIVVGFFSADERLCGVLDVVRDFREPGEWYLGLLLFEPSARGQGHGETALDALELWLRSQSASRIRLACAEQNAGGRRFCERRGFREDKRFPARTMGARQTVLLELVRAL
jgi:GNAT superfamily N-acetyltransferase